MESNAAIIPPERGEGQVASLLTYELNQPLHAILIYARATEAWARRAPPAQDEILAAMAGIMAAAEQAHATIRSLQHLVAANVAGGPSGEGQRPSV